MELFFTAVALALAAGTYGLYQYLYGSQAVCRRPMSEWLNLYVMASPLEQLEMAEILLRQSLHLAGRMGIRVERDDLLPVNAPASQLVEAWHGQLYGEQHLASLPVTPAQTIGALLVIRQAQPQRYDELFGCPQAGNAGKPPASTLERRLRPPRSPFRA